MKTVKNTKKQTKPAFVVDITNANTVQDVACAIANAKLDAGIMLTKENINALINDAVDKYATEYIPDCVFIYDCCNWSKKTPWYKRFWNWLIGRK